MKFSEKQLRKVADQIFVNRTDDVLRFNEEGRFLTDAEFKRLPKEHQADYKHAFSNPAPKAEKVAVAMKLKAGAKPSKTEETKIVNETPQ